LSSWLFWWLLAKNSFTHKGKVQPPPFLVISQKKNICGRNQTIAEMDGVL
jgi:hypothetical protein